MECPTVVPPLSYSFWDTSWDIWDRSWDNWDIFWDNWDTFWDKWDTLWDRWEMSFPRVILSAVELRSSAARRDLEGNSVVLRITRSLRHFVPWFCSHAHKTSTPFHSAQDDTRGYLQQKSLKLSYSKAGGASPSPTPLTPAGISIAKGEYRVCEANISSP